MKIIRFLTLFFLLVTSYCSASLKPHLSEEKAEKKLQKIHAKFSLVDGSFKEEYPEQVMAAMFITSHDKVLEIGGNIGRNSCVIAALLNHSKNLVVVESDPVSASKLIINRNRNRLHFHVENAAISAIPLFQSGWITVPHTAPSPDYIQVKTITYSELKEKYQIPFNVLVADCEGALYYIFQDDETLLDDVELIIVENDYTNRDHYENICAKFSAHGFRLAYNKAGGWGPCSPEFFQVWKKL